MGLYLRRHLGNRKALHRHTIKTCGYVNLEEVALVLLGFVLVSSGAGVPSGSTSQNSLLPPSKMNNTLQVNFAEHHVFFPRHRKAEMG